MPRDRQGRRSALRRGGAALEPGRTPVTVDVHASAVVAPGARLGPGVTIGPYAVVGEGVELGRGTSVGPHAQLEGPAVFGEENRVLAHAVLGLDRKSTRLNSSH